MVNKLKQMNCRNLIIVSQRKQTFCLLLKMTINFKKENLTSDPERKSTNLSSNQVLNEKIALIA